MLRSYPLTFSSQLLEQDLNNPEFYIVQRTFSCNAETGSATVVVRFMPCWERREITHRRMIQSFLLDGSDRDLDDLYRDPKYRVIDSKQYLTAIGTVVIVDYEIRL